MYLTNNTGILPTASICINKSRLKAYNRGNQQAYYLENDSTFQIELFNPTFETILAKISLNAKTISQSGLVLRPGERVFLDRFIDVPNKFKFETYEVENTSETQRAIQNNGDVKIEFFKEYQQPNFNYYIDTIGIPTINGGSRTTLSRAAAYYHNPNTNVFDGPYYGNVLSTDGLTTNSTLSYNANLTSNYNANARTYTTNSLIETGRVEQGPKSSQEFQNVNKTFNTYPFYNIEYKLLPLSSKELTVDDIKIKRYCTNCGSKSKDNYKYCPTCGEKV